MSYYKFGLRSLAQWTVPASRGEVSVSWGLADEGA